MTLGGFLLLLLIALIAGSLGQLFSGYTVGGWLVSIVVGFIGAWIGTWLARQLGLPELFPVSIEGETFPVLWAIIGSAILSFLLGALTRRRNRLF